MALLASELKAARALQSGGHGPKAVATDGRWVYVARSDGNVDGWDLALGDLTPTVTMQPSIYVAPRPKLAALVVAPERQLSGQRRPGYVLGGAKHFSVIALWNPSAAAAFGVPVRHWRLPSETVVRALATAVVDHRRVLFVGTSSGTIHAQDIDAIPLREAPQDGDRWITKCHDVAITALAAATAADRLVSGARDHGVRVWDARNGALLAALVGHTSVISAVVITADGHRVVASDAGTRALRVWDVENGTCERTIPTRAEGASLALAPNGTRLFAGVEKPIGVWDPRDGRSISIVGDDPRSRGQRLGSRSVVASLALAPNGEFLVSASDEDGVRLWKTSALRKFMAAQAQRQKEERERREREDEAQRERDLALQESKERIEAAIAYQENLVKAAQEKADAAAARKQQLMEANLLRLQNIDAIKDQVQNIQCRTVLDVESTVETLSLCKLLVDKLAAFMQLRDIATEVKCISILETELSNNAGSVHFADMKLLALCRKIREAQRADAQMVEDKNETRRLLMRQYEHREELLIQLRDVRTKAAKEITRWDSIDQEDDDPQIPTAGRPRDDGGFDTTQVTANGVLATVRDSYLPQLEDLLKMDDKLGKWETMDLTWREIFVTAPDLQALSETAKRQQVLGEKFRAEAPQISDSITNVLSDLGKATANVKAALQTGSSAARLEATQQELTATQLRLLEMREAETIAKQVSEYKKANRLVEDDIFDTMKTIDTLGVEAKFTRDPEQRTRLQNKIQDAEAKLAVRLKESQVALDFLEQHSAVLHEAFPELLKDQAAVVADARALWRSNLIDESLTIDRYRLQQWLTVDRVMVMQDPFGQVCVVKKLVGWKQVRREADRLCRLQHPLIVRITRVILDAVDPDSICYMQMPYYEHGNLRSWIERIQEVMRTQGCLSECREFIEVQKTFRQIAQALAHVHAKGVVHRDLKPENVLVAKGGKVALCDFGISSDVGTMGGMATIQTTTNAAGTPAYMAPEMLLQDGECSRDWRSCATAVDMWSLGCMVLELLLPVFPRVFGNSAGSTLSTVAQPLYEIDWTRLIGAFEHSLAMQALCRLCAQLLRENPDERLTASEVLLEPALSSTLAASTMTPIEQSSLLLSRLVGSRKPHEKPVEISLRDDTDKNREEGESNLDDRSGSLDASAVFDTLLADWARLVPDVHVPVVFRDSQGRRRPLSEVLNILFAEVILPSRGLFTQTVEDLRNVTSAEYEHEITTPTKAYLPAVGADSHALKVVGMLLAKCLIEGVRVPIVLNSSCLEFVLGRFNDSDTNDQRSVPMPLDECLACLSETNDSETMLYRNILLTRQHERAEYPLEIGVLVGSDAESEQIVTDDNKHRVVCESIWYKLIGCRRDALTSLRDGFKCLQVYEELRVISGRELQRLFYGNDFIDVTVVKDSVRFLTDAWPDESTLASVQEWFHEWLDHVSDVTLRLLLLRVFRSHHVIADGGAKIIVVPSADENVQFLDRGFLALPVDCKSFESLELRLGQALVMSSVKSESERRRQLSQQDWKVIVGALRGEIRAGGWYQCPRGHVYAVGECGGPMQAAQCPECGERIGGQNHRLTGGNAHAAVDGSNAPAWPQ